jgi:hypothetical protein
MTAFEILQKHHDYIQRNGEKPSEYEEDKIIAAMEEYAQQQVKNLNIPAVISSYSCLIEQLGLKSKKVFYIPIKDKNGISLDKSLRVVEGSKLHKKLLNGGTELPKCWIVEE